MGIYLGSTRLDGGGGGTLPTGLIISRSVNKAFSVSTGLDSGTVVASVPRGYTFLCWVGAHDSSKYAVVSFINPTSATSHICFAHNGGSSGNRTFTFYYLCILSTIA